MPLLATLLASTSAPDPSEHVVAHGLFRLWSRNIHLPSWMPLSGEQAPEFWFTNHLVMTLIAAGLTFLVFTSVARRYKAVPAGGGPLPVPRGFSGMMEAFMDVLRTSVVRPLLKDQTDRFMPFLWTMFFFILINNLLGMVPLSAMATLVSGGTAPHLFGTATGNLSITLGLAIVAFLTIHFGGTRQVFESLVAGTYGHHDHDDHAAEHGGGHDHDEHGHHGHHDHGHVHHGMSPGAALALAPFLYLWNFAPHPFKPSAHASGAAKAILWFLDVPMWAILLVLEFIGAVVKPFALSIRLFANMVAGHIVLGSLLLLLPATYGGIVSYLGGSLPIVFGCTAMSFLELFVAFLQAYIFMFLTTIFLSMSVYPEH